MAVYFRVSTPRINVLMVGWIQGENPEGTSVVEECACVWGGRLQGVMDRGIHCTVISPNLALCLQIFIIRC